MTVDEFWSTRAGGELFNAITYMMLVDSTGRLLYFSKRMDITKHILGMLLEMGLVPGDRSPLTFTPTSTLTKEED